MVLHMLYPYVCKVILGYELWWELNGTQRVVSVCM